MSDGSLRGKVYEGKLSFKERMKQKLKTSNTRIKAAVELFRFVLMLGVSFVIIYPFISMIAGSFMTKEDVVDSTISLIPKHPTLEIYKAIIVENHYLEALLNTVILALCCALIQMMISCLVGYGLAKFKFKGNKLVMGLVILTMIIPHGAISLSMSRHFTNFDLGVVMAWGYDGIIELITGSPLQLSNTFAPLIILSICGLAFKNGLYIYLMRQFFKNNIDKVYLIPDVYVVPPSLKTTYTGASLYHNVVENTGGLMIIAPLVILYLFCQRYLVQGIERSGIVG